ncbi:hypothetical protein CPAR01_08617 [Colletotrichum paranaense]|uniref:Uncharacterized protein n=1 Tax=Colletotrichum paranaense TaxID=1914294 RepID=A0ABQ9SKS3_9PEZI|nr:uncharacterized protein CPAR01_08617 [Colletotrichum paranaense]KAK1538504.1 hypothetical protein CPAR01_08617 [Colletotrichum paranaense]
MGTGGHENGARLPDSLPSISSGPCHSCKPSLPKRAAPYNCHPHFSGHGRINLASTRV